MEWISVKDRLPEIGKKVLVIQDPKKTATRKPLFSHTESNNGVLKFRSYHQSGERSYLGHWTDITHWMPLPEPPKQ